MTKDYPYALDVGEKFNTQWRKFYNMVEESLNENIDDLYYNGDKVEETIDSVLTAEYNGYNPDWDSALIYFASEEDATYFLLKFAA